MTYSNFSIIVVDNGSTDQSADAIERWGKDGCQVEVLRNAHNLGFIRGSNIGMKRAIENEPPYILLLNNDTVVTPTFLEALVTVAERNDDIGIVGPKVYQYDEDRMFDAAGTRAIIWLGQPFLRGRDEIDQGQYDQEEDMPYITGCALLVKCSVIERIGLMDEDYFNYFDDMDWGVRARQAGYRLVYVPQAVIRHKGSKAIGFGSPFYYYHMMRSRILFVRKHISWIPFFFCFLPYIVLYRYIGTALQLLPHWYWPHIHALTRGFMEGFTTRLTSTTR
jgi:hypothetical protein